ncbi:MAG TPA: alpha/beta hydrolase [Acidimicrobiales bacterium]|nr:alpha/beta hydrolase [Acidimicrobiales bacterium]
MRHDASVPDTTSWPGLDPELATLLGRMPTGAGTGFDDMDLVRWLRDTPSMLRGMGRDIPTRGDVQVENRTLPSGVGARIYTPGEHHGGVLLFLHGGGYVIGDLYIEEQRCLTLASAGQCLVVSVDYALAPEQPYPAALDDALAGLAWVAAHAGELGADASRLGVGGSSAGAGLAAAVCLAARDRGGPAIAFQLLVYPMLDDRLDTPSQIASTGMALIDRVALGQAWSHYLGGRPADAYAAPARAEDLSGLPPAYVLAAEHDPLRDEDLAYARRLVESGVPTELHLYPGTFHGFDLVGVHTDVGRRAVAEQADALRRALRPKQK